jgi:hypothetical protein
MKVAILLKLVTNAITSSAPFPAIDNLIIISLQIKF